MLKKPDTHIPNPVLGLTVENDWNLLTAWCRYLGLSWKDVATRADIGLLALSRLEEGRNQQSKDLERIATAMGVKPEQLIDS